MRDPHFVHIDGRGTGNGGNGHATAAMRGFVVSLRCSGGAPEVWKKGSYFDISKMYYHRCKKIMDRFD